MDLRFSLARRALLPAAALGCCYFLACALAIRFSRLDGGVAFIWIGNALLLARLMQPGPRRWPLAACLIGGIVASATVGIGPAAAPFLSLANVAESMLGAALLRRFGARPIALRSLRDVMVFVTIVGIAAPAVAGIPGAGIVTLATGVGFWRNWAHWTLGHGLGTIAFTPIAALVLSGELKRRLADASMRCRVEAAALMLVNIATAMLVFGQSQYPLLFLPMLPLVVAAFRLGLAGAAASISIIIAIGAYSTANGSGPIFLIHDTLIGRVEFFQLYVAVAALLALPISAELQRRAALFVALQESEARYRLIADRSGDIVLNISPEGEIRYVSPSIATIAGYDPAAMLGRRMVLCAEEDLPATTAAHQHALLAPDDTQILEYRLLTADGGLLWCEAHFRGVVDDAGTVVSVVSATRDISRRKAIEHELTVAATTDPLTGLANRRTFAAGLEQRIAQVSAGEGHGACAIFDLDLFKQVNDRHGHDAGDRVLRAVAKAACDAVRGSDLVARLGGEEFGIVLWAADMAAAEAVCERLRRRIADMVVRSARGEPISVTISIGLAGIAGDIDADGLLRAADAALYEAKSAGRNRLMLAA